MLRENEAKANKIWREMLRVIAWIFIQLILEKIWREII